jgi:hypothetical protein
MNEFPYTIKLVLFVAEAIIFVVLLIKSAKLAKVEEQEFLEGERVRIAGERANAPGR